jgi:WD40 repeat protein
VRATAAISAVLAVTALGLGLAGPGEPTPAVPPPTGSSGAQADRVSADPPGDPLPPGAIARMGSLRLRHNEGVGTLAFGLDGKVLVSKGDRAALVWDARTGRLLQAIGRRHEDPSNPIVVAAVGMSADGRTLTVQANRIIDQAGRMVNRCFTWALEGGGRELRDFQVRQPPGRQAFRGPHVFAPDGSAMAEVEEWDNIIWVWDQDGNSVARLEVAMDKMGSLKHDPPVAFAPDGKTLYTVLPDHTVKAWDVATGVVVRSFGTGKPRPHRVAVSADGKRLATFAAIAPKGGPDWVRVPEAVRVWNPATGDLVREFAWNAGGNDNAFTFLGFDGGRVWAATTTQSDLAFRLFDPATGKTERDWTATSGGWASTVALSPDAKVLTASLLGGVIQLFDAATGKDVTPGGGHRTEIYRLQFTPDGKQLVTVSQDRTARTWDVTTGKELARRDGLGEFNPLSADGSIVFVTRWRRPPPDDKPWDVVATDRVTGRQLWKCSGSVKAHPDGKTVWAYQFEKKTVAVLDAATGQMLRELSLSGFPYGFGNAGRLVVCFDRKELTGWDADTGQKRFGWDPRAAGLLRSGKYKDGDQDREYADDAYATNVSPDGKFVALTVTRRPQIEDEKGALYVCDATTGKVVWRVKSDQAHVRSVEFSPDGKQVAVGGGNARLFDAATGEEKAVLDGRQGFVAVVAFSRDGKRLATGGSDGTAVVWDVSGK